VTVAVVVHGEDAQIAALDEVVGVITQVFYFLHVLFYSLYRLLVGDQLLV